MGRAGIRRIGGGNLPSSPPMAQPSGGPISGRRGRKSGAWKRLNPLNRAGRTWRPCSEMGPQTLRVGGDAKEGKPCSLPRNLEPQILPIGIALRDQIDLVLPPIGFQGFFASNRCADLIMQLIPDERLAAILLREPSKSALAVLPDALDKVGRNPGVERALLAIGHHVDGNYAVLIGHAQPPSPTSLHNNKGCVIPDGRRPSGNPSPVVATCARGSVPRLAPAFAGRGIVISEQKFVRVSLPSRRPRIHFEHQGTRGEHQVLRR